MADLTTGANAVVDQWFTYVVYNLIKNNWSGTSRPSGCVAGMCWYHSTLKKIYLYDGTSDIELNPSKLMVSSDDTTPNYLESKLSNAGNVDFTVVNPGANETIKFNYDGTGLHSHTAAHALAYQANQASIADSTWTKSTLGTERFDTGANFASGAFTAPVTGVYSVHAHVRWDVDDAGKEFRIALYTNGAMYPTTSGYYILPAPSAMENSLAFSKLIYLAATNYVELYVWHNTSATETLEWAEMSVGLVSQA